ncbi:MAG TPA: ATP-binding protein [Chthoniobacterales bacterium]|jgi:PAS domain S-box-containing protein
MTGGSLATGREPRQNSVELHFSAALHRLQSRTDRVFAFLLLAEWIAAVILALTISPRTWSGSLSEVHMHVWSALALGGSIVVYPIWLGLKQSGEAFTRHLLAIAQMLMSALLIHLTGGRIETHFHIFGSLAFLASYRDLRVLLSATVVVYLDHLVRGYIWPESVYGVLNATAWRSVEHAFWVSFEVAFLAYAIRLSLKEMRLVAERQVLLENVNEKMEEAVSQRTAELAVSEERFRALFQNSPVGLYQATADGTLTMVNSTLLNMLGYSSQEELLAAQKDLWDEESTVTRKELLREMEENGEILRRDAMWRHREGSSVFVRESAKAKHDEAGEVLHVEGSVEDVTEQRQLEERYLQAQKVQAIGQLAGGVAHDFNNILTAILGYSEMLLDQVTLPPTATNYVNEIKNAGERASGLTQQLLAFSRKQTLQPRVIQLNTVVNDMHGMLKRLVGENIEICTDTEPNLARVKADPGQIQQVLLNLVVNARDAMPSGGRLRIETSNAILDHDYARLFPEVTEGRYVMFAVSDTGMGIPPDIAARIFEPFFTTKEVGTGTGLGLSTCHGIIKQSGGHIAVYSEIGHGSTFKVYLPQTQEMAEEPYSSHPSDGPTRGSETILLVEDEPMVRELAHLALASLGYQVIEAENGVEALQRFQELGARPLHLLVTDVVMPMMGGRELAARIRELSPTTRVLFNSGYSYEAIERTDLLDAGVFFLQKPYTMSVLGKKVREVLQDPDDPDAAASDASLHCCGI